MTLRIFHDGPLTEGGDVPVAGDEFHYLLRVRRAKPGAAVEILDGRGTIAQSTLVHCNTRQATLRVQALSQPLAPANLELWLGVPDATACLSAISSACELGCTDIVLVRCVHSAAHTPGDARTHKVIRAAMRQSGRAMPPSVRGPIALQELLDEHPTPCGMFAWERMRGAVTVVPLDVPPRLLVGPEGGLSDDEAAACRARQMVPLSLGPWTLRTETAVVAGLARIRPC